MAITKREYYEKRFQMEKAETSYLKFYNTLKEAVNALCQVPSTNPDAWGLSIWRTPKVEGERYTIVKDEDRQAALDFGYAEVYYGERGEYLGINETCDGSKTYVYKQYKELGLL